MKKLILAAAAAAFLVPAAVSSASAEDVSVRINADNGHHYGWRNRTYAYSPSNCRMVTVREHHNGKLIIKKFRRCN